MTCRATLYKHDTSMERLVIILLHKGGLGMIKGPDIQVAEYHHQQASRNGSHC